MSGPCLRQPRKTRLVRALRDELLAPFNINHPLFSLKPFSSYRIQGSTLRFRLNRPVIISGRFPRQWRYTWQSRIQPQPLANMALISSIQQLKLDGLAVLIPSVANRYEYEAYPGHETVRRVVEETIDEDSGHLAYTTKFQDGHVETVGLGLTSVRHAPLEAGGIDL